MGKSLTSVLSPQGQVYWQRWASYGQVSDFCSLTSGWSKGNSLSAARTSLGKSMGLTSVLSPRLKGKSLTSVTLSLWRGKCSLRRVFLQLGTRFSPPDSILSAARTSLCLPQGQVFVGLKDSIRNKSLWTSLCRPQGQHQEQVWREKCRLGCVLLQLSSTPF